MKIWLAAFLSVAACIAASAQMAIGDWQIYNNYSPDVVKVLDTKHKVYYTTGGNLYSFDKDTEEMFGYTSRNSLNDIYVSNFFRHPDRNYLFVVYNSGNIDILDDYGGVVNLSDIKDAQYVSDRTVNDVAFDDNTAYVATGFGLVKFNLDNYSVIESGMFGVPVTAVAVMGDNLAVCVDGKLLTLPKKSKINSLGSFKELIEINSHNLEALSDEYLMSVNRKDGKINILKINFADGGVEVIRDWSLPSPSDINRLADRLMVSNTGGFFTCRIDNGNLETAFRSTPDESRAPGRNRYSLGYDDNSLWYINSTGLGCMRYDSDMSNPEHVMMPARPAGTNVPNGIQRMTLRPDGSAYLYNVCARRFPDFSDLDASAAINLFSDGFVDDITPGFENVEIKNPNSGSKLKAPFNIVPDPEDPEAYYMGTWFEGIYKIKDGKQTAKYDWTNSPLTMKYAAAAMNIAIDGQGNLWVYQMDASPKVGVLVLPDAKRRLGNTAPEDWIKLDIPSIKSDDTRNALIFACRHPKNKNVVFVSEGYENRNFCAYYTNGTIDNLSDDVQFTRNRFTDQDGKTFGPFAVISMAEDHNGDIWMGTEDGVVVIHNVVNMTNASGTVERVKVPRNDGTNYADYLLQSQEVTAIAVDGANRKWLATANSGVYLVSADGREILENFNSENSYLPSNQVLDVVCDPNSNKVYFGTSYGLAVYSSTSAPAEDDYSEVYAYPNPVRPDYTGWITIKGLMDHSLVKIADASGNVLFQTRSEGGMVVWDGCGLGGGRVRTGVYYVYASQNENGMSGDVVAKIMVVN